MSKRVTIVLDDDLVKKLRTIQSKKITKSKASVSFSSIVNEELRKSLK
jgi:predicted transcriptional regulator